MRHALINIFILGLAALNFSSCKKELQTAPAEQIGVRKYNLSYGPDTANTMDVCLPANTAGGQIPFAILVHGGGWIAGNKADMNGFQEQLIRMGIATASINYRFANKSTVHYREMMDDIAAAIAYCDQNADTWHVRHQKFVLVGASAGAHMSLMYGYDFDPENKVSGIVSLSGPTDFTDVQWLYGSALRSGLVPAIQMVTNDPLPHDGKTPGSYVANSPALAVKNTPTLIIHGTADSVVDYRQADFLNNQLTQRGYTARLLPIVHAGHSLNMDDAITANMIFNEIGQWVKQYSR